MITPLQTSRSLMKTKSNMCVYDNDRWIDVGGAWIDIKLYYVEGKN